MHTILASFGQERISKQHYPSLGHQEILGATHFRECWPGEELPYRFIPRRGGRIGVREEGVVPLTPLKFKVLLCLLEERLLCLSLLTAFPRNELVVILSLLVNWLWVATAFFTVNHLVFSFHSSTTPSKISTLSIWET